MNIVCILALVAGLNNTSNLDHGGGGSKFFSRDHDKGGKIHSKNDHGDKPVFKHDPGNDDKNHRGDHDKDDKAAFHDDHGKNGKKTFNDNHGRDGKSAFNNDHGKGGKGSANVDYGGNGAAVQNVSGDQTAISVNADGSLNTFTSSYIDMEARAADYKEAFSNLSTASPNGDIYLIVRGRSIDNIHDVSITANRSLLVVSYGKQQPYHTEVVKAEDVEQIGLRSTTSSSSPVRVYFPQSTDAIPHTHREIHSVDDMSIDGPSQNPGEVPAKP